MNKGSHNFTECQLCGTKNLDSIIFLGFVPPVNSMETIGCSAVSTTAYPLELVRCASCGLAQLNYAVSASVLFPETYPYLSGTTRILKDNFRNQSMRVNGLMPLDSSSFVVDVGSNDGTLLKNYIELGATVLGIEPSQAADVANKNGITTWKSYFDSSCVSQIIQKIGSADLITACNVFAHIDDVHALVTNIKSLMKSKGVFVSESHYFADLIDSLQYDTIYHEHLRYYDVRTLNRLFKCHGLELFHVERIPTHGGSIRCFVAHPGSFEVDESVKIFLEAEDQSGLSDGSALKAFRSQVVSSKIAFYSMMSSLGIPGKTMYGVGAPSRASTLVSYLGLNVDLMSAVVEVAGSHKIGKYMPGTRIPVIDESALILDQPDYALILSWHIADELISSLRNKGFNGKFIVPLPNLSVVN